jgi:hypothetical protein
MSDLEDLEVVLLHSHPTLSRRALWSCNDQEFRVDARACQFVFTGRKPSIASYDRSSIGRFDIGTRASPRNGALISLDPLSESEIKKKYDRLRQCYSYAGGLFDAFEEHDLIDAGLEHCEWVLEQWLRESNMPTREERANNSRIIQTTSECFAMFYRGIKNHCATTPDPLVHPRASADVICYQ